MAARVGRRAGDDHVDPRHDDRQRRDRDAARDLDASLSAIQWVSTGYLLALATVIPLTGWSMERFGGQRVDALGALFLAGSGCDGDLRSRARAQGFGGGMILPIGQAILAQAAGPQRMGRVMSVIGVPTLLGPILGPVIGGLIVDNFSWRWIFFVNLPVGVVALALARRTLPRAERVGTRRLDVAGCAALAGARAAGLRAVGVGTRGDGARPRAW